MYGRGTCMVIKTRELRGEQFVSLSKQRGKIWAFLVELSLMGTECEPSWKATITSHGSMENGSMSRYFTDAYIVRMK